MNLEKAQIDISHFKLVVGIDLGTSHCSISSWEKGKSEIHQWPIPQLSDWGEWIDSPTIPSSAYVPTKEQLLKHKIVPDEWKSETEPKLIFGSMTKETAIKSPNRSISSSKSWLCHPFAQRKDQILPWDSPIDLSEKFSPVEVASELLIYLKNVVKSGIAKNHPKKGFDWETEVYTLVTIPASFNEEAKSLTLEACKHAGLKHIRLLEEPIAALYAWIYQNHQDWRHKLKPNQTILVCDVGGGTTDFSLVVASETRSGDLNLERVTVGEHLLLGGDNMDLALAYYVKNQLEQSGKSPSMSSSQLSALVSACRKAKEKILSDKDNSTSEYRIAIAGSGMSLLKQSISYTLKKSEVESTILQGFFPKVEKYSQKMEDSYGISEMGLPFATDPRITTHLAEFMQHASKTCKNIPKFSSLVKENCISPDWILFNGGVFHADQTHNQVINCLDSWQEQHQTQVLDTGKLDTAVSIGASYLGSTLISKSGIRIAAGTARSYYLGIESNAPSIPGIPRKISAVCVAPQGSEEGEKLPGLKSQFALTPGRKVRFRFFTSSDRSNDKVGDFVSDPQTQLSELSHLELNWSDDHNPDSTQRIPVALEGELNETGILELFFISQQDHRGKWKLDLNLRKSESIM